MAIIIHPHAYERMMERGASKEEVIKTIETGENFPAKYDRLGFRYNFPFNAEWRGKIYSIKQLEVYAVKEDNDMIIITIITRYF
jgi:hypothetical protein